MFPRPPTTALTIGELAARTGLTTRALRHYDAIGLVIPAERSHAGHRSYGPAEIERLYQVIALRRLGLSLDVVAATLDSDDADLAAVVRGQLEVLDARLELERRLRALLEGVLEGLGRLERPSVDHVLEIVEVTEMMERYYTPEQLEQLERRRRAMSEEDLEAVHRAWEEIFTRLRDERAAGTDPADPRLDAVRTRIRELIATFHGGDDRLKASMTTLWRNENPSELTRGALDADLAAYMSRVQTAASTC